MGKVTRNSVLFDCYPIFPANGNLLKDVEVHAMPIIIYNSMLSNPGTLSFYISLMELQGVSLNYCFYIGSETRKMCNFI